MTGADPLTLQAIDRIATRAFAAGAQPGLAYGVLHARPGQPSQVLVHSGGLGVCRAGGGPGEAVAPDADSVFRIASMTKSFTAALIVLLAAEGALRLDDPVARYVPELADLRLPTADSPTPTVRHLLTMSGGLPTDDPWGDRQQALPHERFGALLREGLSFVWTPGTTFEYSNLGYAVLGRVAAAAGGAPYRDLLRRRLLAPLGLTATALDADDVPPGRLVTGHLRRDGEWLPEPFDDEGAFAPMGGLFSSVRDVATWVGGLCRAFPPRDGEDGDRHPLSRAARREMQQQHRVIPPRYDYPGVDLPAVAFCAGYGYGLVVEHDRRWGVIVQHSGGYPGFGSHMRWHPETGLGVVVLANSTYAPARVLATAMLDRALAGASRRGGGTPRSGGATVWPVPVWPATLAAQREVTALIDGWDGIRAGAVVADNVDLDDPLPRRAQAIAEMRDRFGPLGAHPEVADLSQTPAHRRWWLRGTGGSVQVEIRLTPERAPRVQTLAVTAVVDPGAQLLDAARSVLDALNAEVDLADGDERTRQLRAAAAWAGRCTLGQTLAGDGRTRAVIRLNGRRAGLLLTLGLGAEGRIVEMILRPDPEALPASPDRPG